MKFKGFQGPTGNLKCNVPAKYLKAKLEKQKTCKKTAHLEAPEFIAKKHPAEMLTLVTPI